MQVVELVELIEHGRLCRRWCRWRWRWRWWRLLVGLRRRGLLVLLLLLKVRDALVLIGLRVRLLLPPPELLPRIKPTI